MKIRKVSSHIAYLEHDDSILKCSCGTNAISVYLNSAREYKGTYTIKKIDTSANAVTIYPDGTETIDGVASVTLVGEGDYKTLVPVKNGWTVVDEHTFINNQLVTPIIDSPIITGTGKVNPVAATGTLTIDTNPTLGDVFKIGTTQYTIVAEAAFNAAGEIVQGANVEATQANIVSAINGTDGINITHPLVTISDFADNVAVVTALVAGAAGNTIDTITQFTAGTNVFSAATLAGGYDNSLTVPKLANPIFEITLGTHDYGGGTEDWVLTPSELAKPFHKPTNASGGVNAIIPATPCVPYVFINGTGQVLSIEIPNGLGGVSIASSKTAIVMSDGTSVIALATESA
jgi:hypothetical protein